MTEPRTLADLCDYLQFQSSLSQSALLRLSHQSQQRGLLPPTPPRVNAQDPRPSFAFSGIFSETSWPVGPREFLPGSGAPSLPLPWW